MIKKWMSSFVASIIVASLVLSGCAPKSVQPFADWWKNAVFYEIFVRSFADSNGDGIGDFQGIIDHLDYLNDGNPKTHTDLGVTALWLMPINPSPSYHGYDVTDYYTVNPDYGSLDDFKRLLDAAHKRGIHVIIDMVFNHTSSQHPWFQAAQDPASPYHDWYVWSDTNPDYKGPDGQTVWYKAANGEYYYAIFWDQMPDLNYTNPAVTDEMEKVSSFWLKDVGVDGFRIDAAKHLIEDGSQQENTDATHAWFKNFYSFYKGINPQAMTVGEVWSSSFETLPYVKNDELDMVFDFDLASAILSGVNKQDANGLMNKLTFETRLYPAGDNGIFLSNHDQDRSLTVLQNDVGKAKLAATLYLTSPGVPFIYYGEEIGLTGSGDDQNKRRPMQWTGEAHAGFSSVIPWAYPDADFKTANVASEDQDPQSLLNFYRQVLAIRSQNAALIDGSITGLTSGNGKVMAYLRQDADETILVVVNLSQSPVQDYQLSLVKGLQSGTYHLQTLLGDDKAADLTVNAAGGMDAYQPLASLAPETSYIFKFNP